MQMSSTTTDRDDTIDRKSWMMSAAETKSTLESRLDALQSHFTWDLVFGKSILVRLRDTLKDIGTDERNYWLGHVYNLQGFVHYHMGLVEEARSFLSKATEAFHQIRKGDSDDGPWLLVNYGNLAWLHHYLGEEEESESYLSKVDGLMKEYPSPSEDELHPEVYAEKAWTLLHFDKDEKKQAADYFQRAIRMQPDMVEWQTSYVLGLLNASKHETSLSADLLEKLRAANEKDPENMYLSVQCLEQKAKESEDIEEIKDEARELAEKILMNPVGSYSGMKAILRLYKKHFSYDDAIILAEEALRKHPDNRYLKRCAALCYKWKIIYEKDTLPRKSMMDRTIDLHKDLISLYPDSALVKKIDLASIYAKSSEGLRNAEQIYQELLEEEMEPLEKQMLYNRYSKYLTFDLYEQSKSIDYLMKSAEIPHQSFFRENSIKDLESILRRGKSRRCSEIKEFLKNLQDCNPV
ncbi:interferon-induced protein with tetratricopeptide repeats 2-like [Mugil cephalus]|uniref:interferon-induced protein with tetratricopeptide repeats 2-like n=1 Tax=Mugil cephalus TaxID=48193 RepID=UPI001FB5C4AF|nr:interferon-induced protein with tetratricopeptide repeats 2-like [Mugil cephalus]